MASFSRMFHRQVMMLAVTLLWCASSAASAAMQFTLSGSASKSYAGYQVIESGTLSGGLSTDLGPYFRIGFTHTQQRQNTKGFAHDDYYPTQYPVYESQNELIMNSVDLTIVLYGGDVFTPYVFVGPAWKSYHIVTKEAATDDEGGRLGKNAVNKDESAGPVLVPSGGAGLAIRLSQKFALKLSYTASMSTKRTPNKLDEGAIDGSGQVGIQYTF